MYNNWWNQMQMQSDCIGYTEATQNNYYLYDDQQNCGGGGVYKTSPPPSSSSSLSYENYNDCQQFFNCNEIVSNNNNSNNISCVYNNPVPVTTTATNFNSQNIPRISSNQSFSTVVAPQVVPAVFSYNNNNHNYPAPSVINSVPSLPPAHQYYMDIDSHAPCQGPRPWNYAYCYGYYGEPACQFVDVVDIEDFMSNEKRKEKSRDAARCRRSRETEIFTELSHVLPLRREDVEQLDKASVMRLSIAFLKIREMLKLFPKVKDIKTEKSTTEEENKLIDLLNGPQSNKLITQAMDGFLIILSSEGDVTYVSENITDYLGISQIDILGQQIWEYSHQCDHDELKDTLNVRRISADSIDIVKKDEKIQSNNNDDKTKINDKNLKTVHCDIHIRLKCTLTSRGRSVNIKSASYKLIHMTGHIIMNGDGEHILVAIGRPLPHPSNIETPLGSTTFLTKHSLDMKFTYVDDNMLSLLGYSPDDLIGKSLYDYHYSGDSDNLMSTFKSVIHKGQGETNRYRFLGKYGGYSWIVTQATILYDKQKPQGVVCVNYAISNLENDNEIYSCEQLEAFNKRKISSEIIEDQQPKQQQQQQIPHLEQKEQQQQQQQQPQKSETIKAQTINKLPPTGTGSIKQHLQQSCIVENSLTKNSQTPVKLPNQQPQPQQQIFLQQKQNLQTQSNLLITTTTTINNNNNNKPTEFIKREENNIYCRENSLSPSPATNNNFNKCSTNPIIGLNNKIINNNSVPQQQQHQQQQQQQQQQQLNIKPSTVLIQRGGPKTVTASVFKKVSVPPTKLGFSSATSPIVNCLNNNLTQQQFQQPPKPQSVTTSVLIPISSLSKTSSIQQNFNNRPLFISPIVSGGSGIGGTINSSSDSSVNKTTQQQQLQQRSEDMNKGFSMFLDDPTELTMLKEEPDDLTHLAPTAGDACIPLDDPTPLFGEMLEGLILPDSYGTLLSDDINSLDSQQSNNNNNCNTNNKTHIDPFISYRDESSDTTGSPHLLSPGASKSPEVSSIPSLCSPNSLSQDDEFAFMTMNDEIDLTMRAPYIPMNEQEDLPLLTEDLMWSAFTEELHKDIKEALQIEIKNNCNISINAINNNNNTNNTLNICNNKYNNNNNNNNNNNSNSLSSSNNSSSSNNNNNIDANNESSLAALLCSTTNSIQQQQQQQSHNIHNGNTIGTTTSTATILGQVNNNHHNQELNKKRKFDLNDTTTTSSSSSSKTKMTTTTTSTSNDDDLVDSIDAFGQVFNNKNSPNLDCWTINDLLQINPTTLTTTIAPDTKQNIIVNTAIPTTTTTATTFHVPLITLQHNGNKINLTRSSSIGSINNLNALTKNCNGIGVGIGGIDDQQHCNKKFNLTKLLTTSSSNNTTNNGGGGSGGCGVNGINQKQQQTPNINIMTNNNCETNNHQHHHGGVSCNNKRHLNVSTSLDSKRVKNSSSVEIQTSPQLLQQLIMAPIPQKQKSKSLHDKSQNSKWGPDGGGGGGGNGNQQQQQQIVNNNNTNNNMSSSSSLSSSPSNSVLKNLLVSGCDGDTFSPQSPDILMIDESSKDSIPNRYFSQQQLSPGSLDNYSKPLHCNIINDMTTNNNNASLSQLLRYCGSNPMIGGPGILPSPPIPIPSGIATKTNDVNKNNCDKDIQQNIEQQKQKITSSTNFMVFSPKINDSDSGSDSGVECGSNHGVKLSSKLNTSIMYPIKKNNLPPNLDPYADDSVSMSGDEAPPPLEPHDFLSTPSLTVTANIPSPSMPTSLYSPLMMDTNNCNTLNGNNSPFNGLMDLCTDDYAMTDLLQDNEITKVFDEWNTEMT